VSRRKKGRFKLTMLTADELGGCRERALVEARGGRTRCLSLEWIENEQRETERAFKEGRRYQVPLEKTREELVRLEELKWLPFKRHPYWNTRGGRRAPRRSLRLRKARRPSSWMYWPERGSSKEPKGPIALAALLDMILSRRLSEEAMVVPSMGGQTPRKAMLWAPIARRLPLNLAELCRVWVRGSSRRKWPNRDWWAYEKATRQIETNPAHGWRVICGLVAAAPSDAVLGNIGAGYVEDFIDMYPAYHARIVARAKRDKKFRRCLSFAYCSHLTRPMIDVLDEALQDRGRPAALKPSWGRERWTGGE
jgi:uncharacterized protein DUF6869